MDYGKTFKTHIIQIEKPDKYNFLSLITDIDQLGTNVMLIAKNINNSHSIGIKLDFQDILNLKKCSSNDYENYSILNNMCRFGVRTIYKRRKSSEMCIIANASDLKREIEFCECDRNDYECDDSHDVDENNECHGDHPDYRNIPKYRSCKQFFYHTRGYSKKLNTKCKYTLNKYEPYVLPYKSEKESDFVLYATNNKITALNLYSKHKDFTFTYKLSNNQIEYDYDMEYKCLFFYSDKNITRQCVNDNNGNVVIANNLKGSISGIHVDWINKNLYWFDATHIMISSYNGTGSQVLKSYEKEAENKITSLILDPLESYMYWTVYNSINKTSVIVKAWLDATNIDVLNSINEEVNNISYDQYQKKLYWYGLSSKNMFYYALKDKIYNKLISINELFAAAVYKNEEYWYINRNFHSETHDLYFKFFKIKKSGENDEELKNLYDVIKMRIYNELSQLYNKENFVCRNRDIHNCSNICIALPLMSKSPGDFEYRCLNSSNKSSLKAFCDPLTKFQCKNGECLDLSVRCNGIAECLDGSDECLCETYSADKIDIDFNKCNLNSSFICRVKNVPKCLPNRYKCDVFNHCDEYIDELNCIFITTTTKTSTTESKKITVATQTTQTSSKSTNRNTFTTANTTSIRVTTTTTIVTTPKMTSTTITLKPITSTFTNISEPNKLDNIEKSVTPRLNILILVIGLVIIATLIFILIIVYLTKVLKFKKSKYNLTQQFTMSNLNNCNTSDTSDDTNVRQAEQLVNHENQPLII